MDTLKLFDSERTRLRDEVASLIPKSLWDVYFDRTLTGIDRALLTATPDQIFTLLSQPEIQTLSTKRKRCCWIAIYCQHTELDSNLLIQIAIALQINLIEFIQEKDYQFFILTALNLRIDLFDKLKTITSSSESGYLWWRDNVLNIAINKLQIIIQQDNFKIFRIAASQGNINQLNRLIELTPNRVQEMISAVDFYAFRLASYSGHLSIINRLIELAPGRVQEMISANNFYAFRLASYGGHLSIINRLIELASGRVQEMLSADNFAAFRLASHNGHLSIINCLIELVPGRVQEMIAFRNFEAFHNIARHDFTHVIMSILHFPNIFAYVEMHRHEYGERFVIPFIQTQFANIRHGMELFYAEHPHEIFNLVDEEQVRVCFYMSRNLIRRNDLALLDDLRFLLEIPAVRLLAHTDVTPNEQNELLRLALTIGNQDAAALLLTIPAVHALALQNDFYRGVIGVQVDLSALARDRESSMQALNTHESKDR